MKFLVRITELNWIDGLRQQSGQSGQVNLWSTDMRNFRALVQGELLVFKLKKGEGDCIVGCGTFAGYSKMPISSAWNKYGTNNGAQSMQELIDRVRHNRQAKRNSSNRKAQWNYAPVGQATTIGCIVLNDFQVMRLNDRFVFNRGVHATMKRYFPTDPDYKRILDKLRQAGIQLPPGY